MPSPGIEPRAPALVSAPRSSGRAARDRAVRILLRLRHPQARRQGLTVQQAVDAALDHAPRLSPADAALTTELVYGSLRCEPRLDWLLRRLLPRPDKLPPVIRIILLAAAHELLHLDRVPAYATLNWAVQASRDAAGPGLARLVNAVLRGIVRMGENPRHDDWYAEHLTDPVERLSVIRALPAWIAELWLAAYGREAAEALALAAGRTPWPAVRINRTRPGWENTRAALIRAGAHATGPASLAFPPGRTPAGLSPHIQDGTLSWQGTSSQNLLHALRAGEWEGPIWDACAGRGGKTCALLEMGREVRLASDPHLLRLDGLHRELDRLGLPHPELRQGRVQDLDPGFAPRTILLDVPCSGLGALARRPDARLNQTPAGAGELAARQEEIVAAAWSRIAPGGRLAYMTCTVNPAENERQTARILARSDACLEIEIPARPEERGADSMYGALLRKME